MFSNTNFKYLLKICSSNLSRLSIFSNSIFTISNLPFFIANVSGVSPSLLRNSLIFKLPSNIFLTDSKESKLIASNISTRAPLSINNFSKISFPRDNDNGLSPLLFGKLGSAPLSNNLSIISSKSLE